MAAVERCELRAIEFEVDRHHRPLGTGTGVPIPAHAEDSGILSLNHTNGVIAGMLSSSHVGADSRARADLEVGPYLAIKVGPCLSRPSASVLLVIGRSAGG